MKIRAPVLPACFQFGRGPQGRTAMTGGGSRHTLTARGSLRKSVHLCFRPASSLAAGPCPPRMPEKEEVPAALAGRHFFLYIRVSFMIGSCLFGVVDDDLFNDIGDLIHGLDGDCLKPAVGVGAACAEVGARQAHISAAGCRRCRRGWG